MPRTAEPIPYDLPVEIVPRFWGGRFRGQAQTWVLMRYLGRDDQVNIATAHPEFSAWKWVAPKNWSPASSHSSGRSMPAWLMNWDPDMKTALSALLILATAGQAAALSCMRPDPVRTFLQVDADPGDWIVLKGQLDYEQPLTSTDDLLNPPAAFPPVAGQFQGLS